MINYNVGVFDTEKMTLKEFVAYCKAQDSIHTCPTREVAELGAIIEALGY